MTKSGSKSSIAFYAALLALSAFALDWIEYKYLTRTVSTEIYILILVTGFTAFGIWTGHHLSRKPQRDPFKRNDKALESLGVTRREYTVLEHLAEGKSNKQIARDLGISPNTVKSHITSLYNKFSVQGRMQAVLAARALQILP